MVYALYALIMTQSGQVAEDVSMAHQGTNNYSATFTISASAPTGNYVAQVHPVDVAGRTAVAMSNSFTLSAQPDGPKRGLAESRHVPVGRITLFRISAAGKACSGLEN